MFSRVSIPIACAVFGCAIFTACSGGGTPPVAGGSTATTTMSTVSQSSASSISSSGTDTVSILNMLDDKRTIGSAVNPVNGDVNPYGLDVAKVSSGKVGAGDLVVCDFNDKENVQGTGNSILALHPVAGAKPVSITGGPTLLGCDALAMAPSGPIWSAAFAANDNPIFTSAGAFVTALKTGPWHHPFGEAFVPPVNSISVPAFYVSNAGDGSLVRAYIFPGPTFKFAVIATGFPINGGPPGSILGPSGLNYDASRDRLYVVDGQNNALYAIDNVSKVETNGIAVHGSSFTGKFAASAHLLFSGAPLNGPISSAILPGGHVVLGNTLDPDGKNLMVEFNASGKMLAVKNVDTGPAGALFGMVATGTSTGSTKLYFNDDNDNTVKVLEP